jgi:preprotein translocase subunit SecA
MPGPGQQAPGAARNGGASRASRTPARGGIGALAGPGVTGTSGTAAMGTAAGVAGAQQARPGYTPSGAKIGRNDACWCGSGRKYKKCHGS